MDDDEQLAAFVDSLGLPTVKAEAFSLACRKAARASGYTPVQVARLGAVLAVPDAGDGPVPAREHGWPKHPQADLDFETGRRTHDE